MSRTTSISIALLLLITTAPGQTCATGNPTTLGAVQLVSSSCNTGTLPRTVCRSLTVSCTGLPDIGVQVRISSPNPSAPLRGTIVFGTGGGGTGFYSERTGGPELMKALQEVGFQIVERKWSRSWFGAKLSIKKQSCRYATLLTWVHANVHTKGAFCATGNSGGSAELSYALSTWGRATILDVAVPSGGPPMARLDYLCLPSSTWATLCQKLVPPNFSECRKLGCNVSATHPVCTGCSSTPNAANLLADSILHPGAAMSYPNTRVHIVLGARDCTSAVPNAMLFYNAIRTEKAIDWPPGTPHWVPGTKAGRDALFRALVSGASCRPGSAVVPAMPKIGGDFDLEVRGPAGRTFFVFTATQATTVHVPSLGWLFVAPPVVALGGGTLHATTGEALFRLRVPNDASLAGLVLFQQLLTGSCTTNLVRIKIVP